MDATASRLLCVVVPCFDEEQAVGPTYAELERVLAGLDGYRALIYFVDDGSTDDTLARLNELARADRAVRVLSLSRNFGHQAAITAGLEHADPRADVVLVMDADLETPPSLIPRLLAALEDGHDVAMGVRERPRAVGLGKRLASQAFYWVFNQLSEVPIEPGAPDFFALSRRARAALARMPEQRRFLRGMVAWLGFARAYVPYVPPARLHGESKYTYLRSLRFAIDALLGFSTVPVRLIALIGVACVLLGALACLGAALDWPWQGALGPVLALSGVASALTGVLLIALGVVGGYVARSFEAGRGRPLYLLKQAPDEQDEPRPMAEVHALPRSAARH